MEAQLAAFRDARAGGMPRRGWKIGINVPEVLRHLGLRHSGVAWLNGHREYRDGDVVVSPRGARLHVEPELCLEVCTAVSSDASPAAARDAIARVAPALELVDYALPRSGFDAVVAHGMFHHGVVLGAWCPKDRVPELGHDLPVLEVSGEPAASPRPDLVPREPGDVVRFVASFLAAFGESLEAGDLILSGSYTATAVALSPGATVRARYGSLGEVGCRVASR